MPKVKNLHLMIFITQFWHNMHLKKIISQEQKHFVYVYIFLKHSNGVESRIDVQQGSPAEPKEDVSGHLCPSEIKYAKPKASTKHKQSWEFIK